jgi:hypothetical protein
LERRFAFRGWQRFSCGVLLGVGVLILPAKTLLAESCSVVKHGPPTDADTALLTAEYPKAEALYRADLAKHAGDTEATVGLVHALLREQKLQDAADVVKTALAAAPKSGSLLTLRGEVEFRYGEPWLVEPTVIESYKLDPCNPRTRLLFARVSQVNSRYATAHQQILLAHQLDPTDPQIRAAWIQTLPLEQRISETEAYLTAPTGDDAMTLQQTRSDLERLKKLVGQPVRACRLSSAATSADVPFIKLTGWQGHTRANGLEMGLNGTTARLELGAGEGGLTVYRPVAERAGLKRITESEKGTFPGAKPSYTAYADSIKVGNLEFQNCTVKVIDSGSPFDDGDGIIGIDLFGDFLLTVDYPMRKLQLGPLPVRAQDTAAPTLKTDVIGSSIAGNDPSVDRFIAPEMKDYSQIYRIGNGLVLPAGLNAAKVKLFALDVGRSETTVAPEVAREVTKVHEKDLPGQKALIADEITFNFAHLSQKLTGVVSADTSGVSKAVGTEISGYIGANTFSLLIMHIDFRDGLVKFEYIPNRGYKFE